MDNVHFKKILILFWAVWWSIALWTDVVGGLSHLGMLHASWAPDSNYPDLVDSLKMYHLVPAIPAFFFICILAWSLASTLGFVWASLALGQDAEIWMKRARTAFIISLIYWLAFFLADQMVMKFDYEQNHMVQGGFELLCFFALYVLP